MDRRKQADINSKKKERQIDRQSNTALFLLRCSQIGIPIADLEFLSIGMVYDMLTEKQNDDYEYPTLATQSDIDKL